AAARPSPDRRCLSAAGRDFSRIPVRIRKTGNRVRLSDRARDGIPAKSAHAGGAIPGGAELSAAAQRVYAGGLPFRQLQAGARAAAVGVAADCGEQFLAAWRVGSTGGGRAGVSLWPGGGGPLDSGRMGGEAALFGLPHVCGTDGGGVVCGLDSVCAGGQTMERDAGESGGVTPVHSGVKYAEVNSNRSPVGFR